MLIVSPSAEQDRLAVSVVLATDHGYVASMAAARPIGTPKDLAKESAVHGGHASAGR
jgi:hypothetical protein